MKKVKRDELRPEYRREDLGRGVRGKYLKAYRGRAEKRMAKDDPKGSFTRWQSITIVQLTYAINLVLSFSVAVLAFQVTTLLSEEFKPVSWQKYTFLLSLLILLTSVGLGIWCVINRMLDFRATTKVARMREEGKSDEDMQPYRTLYKKYGEKAWRLFWWQIGTFLVGTLLLVLGIAASVSEKLL